MYNRVTQRPAVVTCFTDRRSPRARERDTPIGRFVLVYVSGGVDSAPADGAMTGPTQAFCDCVYVSRRQGVPPESLVTFRNLPPITPFDEALPARYRLTVQKHVARLLASCAE